MAFTWDMTFDKANAWCQRGFLRMFVDAWQERAKIVRVADPYTADPRPEYGCDAHVTPSDSASDNYDVEFDIGQLQEDVLALVASSYADPDNVTAGTGYYSSNYMYWVKSHDGGTMRGDSYFDNTDPDHVDGTASPTEGPRLEPWTYRSWFTEAGFDVGDPGDGAISCPLTRVTGAGTTTGLFQEGDYVGPWIWRELHDLLNLLRWTGRVGDWLPKSNSYYSGSGSAAVGDTSDVNGPYGGAVLATIDEAFAEAVWEAQDTYAAGIPSADAPFAWTNGAKWTGSNSASAQTARQISTARCLEVPRESACDIEWYNYALPDPSGTFEAYGDTIYNAKLYLFDTTSESAGADGWETKSSAVEVGSATVIATGDWVAPGTDTADYEGWYHPNDPVCLFKWTFTYQ